jgi:hypothetical protein
MCACIRLTLTLVPAVQASWEGAAGRAGAVVDAVRALRTTTGQVRALYRQVG